MNDPLTKEHERICWVCHAVYTGPLGPSGKCPNCERGVPADPPLDVWSLNAAKREAVQVILNALLCHRSAARRYWS